MINLLLNPYESRGVFMADKEFEMVTYPQITSMKTILVRLTNRAPHIHKELEIGLILDGDAEIVNPDLSESLKAGDMYIINPMEVHGFHTSKKPALILAVQISRQVLSSFFNPDHMVRFSEQAVHPCFSGFNMEYEMTKELFIEFAYTYFSMKQNYEFKCMSLICMVMYLLSSHVANVKFADSEYVAYLKRQNRIDRVTDYIELHYRDKLLLGELAKHEELSLSYLSHLFSDDMNMSFQDYLNLKRFNYALWLLQNTSKSILSVSIESGFSDVRYLNRLCMKYYGCSPSDLREKKNIATDTYSSYTGDNAQMIFRTSEVCRNLQKYRDEIISTNKEIHVSELFSF
jgi:AraC-like DNA-binding protein/mannose-6-phosphate isomerase-like protein (cupin superfamily)